MIDLHLRLCGVDVDDAARRDVLELVGLGDRSNDRGDFSKGMQQRLGLAVALVTSPELVILDELTSALHSIGRVDVRDIAMTWLVAATSSVRRDL